MRGALHRSFRALNAASTSSASLAPAPAAAPKRSVGPLAATAKDEYASQGGADITMVTYNILADKYATSGYAALAPSHTERR